VPRGKPDPQIYLDAVHHLGLEVAHCLAIEDSPSGWGAILAAGVTPCAVPFMVEVPRDEVLVVLPTLDGVTADHLAVIHTTVAGRRTPSSALIPSSGTGGT
jgi:beta-phosphoglucomutase-like phosphatase (HAD superfamily)